MQVCGVAYLRTQDFDCTKSLSSTMAGSSNTVMAGRSAAQKGGLFEFHRGKNVGNIITRDEGRVRFSSGK